jgi:hypothetical protein
MNLNVDIILENLRQSALVEYRGQKSEELSLQRPELHVANNRKFESNHLYVATADRLPRDPSIEEGAVIICVNGDPPRAFSVGKCVCLTIKDDTDLFTVFNSVQRIYNKYDEWQTSLQTALDSADSIKEMVDLSFSIFENPLIVLDAEFHFIAYSDIIDINDRLLEYRPGKDGAVGLERLVFYLNSYGSKMTEIAPIAMTLKEIDHLSFNLFNNGAYAGSFTLVFAFREQRASDFALAQYLSGVLECSFRQYAAISNNRISNLKSVFRDSLNCFPVDSSRIKHLNDENLGKRYVCLRIIIERSSYKVPAKYLCNVLESTFIGSIAFEHESAFVAFIDVGGDDHNRKAFDDRIEDLLLKMCLKAGISHCFTDLALARYYYRQACIALEIGSTFLPESSYHLFDTHILWFLITNSVGEFSVEFLLNDGIKRVIEHDLTSETNYIQTLRVYLKNNSRITKTAQELYLHRTSLIHRLKRIERILQMDLNNPDHRLRLEITLKAIELKDLEAKT